MISQDFTVHDNDSEGEMNFLLHFYDGSNVVAQDEYIAIKYGASISVYKGLTQWSQQKS